MALLLVDYLRTFGWGLVGAITMAISLWILLRVFTWLTPVDEWEELKKGNVGIAIVMAAVIWLCDCGRIDGGSSTYWLGCSLTC